MRKIKKCCVCEGSVVNGRCTQCGMPFREEIDLYHLNENRRDHLEHMSAKDKQEYIKRQQMSYRQPVQQPVPGNADGRPMHSGTAGKGPAGTYAYDARPQKMPQQKQKNGGVVAIVVFVIMLIMILGPFFLDLFL